MFQLKYGRSELDKRMVLPTLVRKSGRPKKVKEANSETSETTEQTNVPADGSSPSVKRSKVFITVILVLYIPCKIYILLLILPSRHVSLMLSPINLCPKKLSLYV